MRFKTVRTALFRNLTDGIIHTDGTDIFLVGENGQGKTNFLESVYFSAFASSFRNVADREMARKGEKNFSVSAEFNDTLSSRVTVKFEGGKKAILINDKAASDREELLAMAPCIVFCHEDMEFVSGSPERRRWFFDQALSLCDPGYLDALRRYRRLLKSRNVLLKDVQLEKTTLRTAEATLDAIDPQMIAYGSALMEKRAGAVERFSDVFGPLYREVSGIAGLGVRYQPSWKAAEPEGQLAGKRYADAAAGTTLSGPHRDRYGFYRDGADFTATASTGQRRLLALLLRSAQACRYRETAGKEPVLLLDDVLLEMDGEKRRRFLACMPRYVQAFFTFLPEEPYTAYRKADTIVYRVSGGEIIGVTEK